MLIATWPFAAAAARAAFAGLRAGSAALDAVCELCREVEADEAVESVGYGGLPDASGRVTLDALVMLSPARLGAVCALSRHREAIAIARRVMETAPHVLLAGEGADCFADEQGFAAAPLLAPAARRCFEQRTGLAEGASHDTICALALDLAGALAGAASTSGTAFKLPGRVGDTPIAGHGLYVLPGVGAAAATGRGELAMGTCASFVAVDELRRGAPPAEALAAALSRAAEIRAPGRRDQLAMIALAAGGAWACAALEPGFEAIVCAPSTAGPESRAPGASAGG